MPTDADEPPAELRIGRWLPAVRREEGRAEEAPTIPVPVVRAAAGTGAEPPSVDHAPAPPPSVPPDQSPEVLAPVRRRARDLAVVAAVTLAVAAVAAVATAVALHSRPSGTGGEAAAQPTFPTVVATSITPGRASPSGTPQATVSPTPSATSPAPTMTPSAGSPSATPPRAVRLDVSVEAEAPSTTLSGRTRIQAMDGASGGAVVSRIGGGAMHVVRFAPITAAESGTYTLTIHYVSTDSRRAVITVNGTVAAAVTCPARAAVGRVSVQVRLAAGANTIAYGNDDGPAPDLDRITVVS